METTSFDELSYGMEAAQDLYQKYMGFYGVSEAGIGTPLCTGCDDRRAAEQLHECAVLWRDCVGYARLRVIIDS